MGVYIKGLEMPKGDTGVLLALYNGEVHLIGGDVVHVGKGKGFEAVVVPEPHGDLIDRECVHAMINWTRIKAPFSRKAVRQFVEDTPTVIPADPPKEEC